MHRSIFFAIVCFAVMALASAGSPLRRLPRSPAVHPAVTEHLQQIREVMNNVPKLIHAQLTSAPATATKLPTLASSLKFASQANTPCDDAVRSFDRLVKDCNVDEMINGFKNPGLFVNDTVIQFCQPECVGQLNAQLTYVVSNCTGVVANLETGVADFQDALVVARGACKQDTDGNFCPLVYKNISAISVAFLNESLETSSDVLDMAGCSSSCINDEFTTVTEYATSPIMGTMGYHKLLCSQVDLDDCALIYQNYQRNISAQDQNSQLSTVCSPCFRRFVNGLYQMTSLGPVPIDSEDDSGVSAITPQSLAGVLNRLNYLCAVDEAGQFCVQRFSNETSNNITTACGDIFGNTTTCSAECVSAVNDFKNQNGCCTNTYFEMIRATKNGSITDNAQQAIAFFQNQCNVTVASSCAVSTINMTLTLNNIKAEWVQANWPAVQQALRKDLSGRTGIPYALVHIDSYEIYTPGAVVPPPADNSTNSTVPTPAPVSNNSSLNGLRAFGLITPQNEDDVQETFSMLSTGITDLDLDLATTGVAIPLSARVDPLSPLLLDAAQSSVTMNSPQGASTSPAPRSAVLAISGLVVAAVLQLAFSASM